MRLSNICKGIHIADRLTLIPIIGFVTAILGLVFLFIGWNLIESRVIAFSGGVIFVVGFGVGVVGYLVAEIATLRHLYRQFKKSKKSK